MTPLAGGTGSDQAGYPAGGYAQDQDHLESTTTTTHTGSSGAEDQQAEDNQGLEDLYMSFFDLSG